MNLHEHSILRRTIGRPAAAVLTKAGPTGGPITDPHEVYVVASHVAAGELAGLIDQLGLAVLSLSGYRRAKTRQDYPTRAHYLAYHLENHLIRAVSLYDRALVLTNLVFQLGLRERTCSKETVAKNWHVRPTPVFEALTQLEQAVKPWRQKRNIVVHRRAYSDPELQDVEGFYLLEAAELKAGRLSPIVERFQPVYKRITDSYVRERKVELDELNATLEQCVAKLFDALEPEFALRCKVEPNNQGASG